MIGNLREWLDGMPLGYRDVFIPEQSYSGEVAQNCLVKALAEWDRICAVIIKHSPGEREGIDLRKRRAALMAKWVLQRCGKRLGDGSPGSAIEMVTRDLYEGAWDCDAGELSGACQYAL